MMEILFYIFIILFFIIILNLKNIKYKQSSYYKITKNSLLDIKNNKGKYGEFLIYDNLKYYEELGGKFLFNLYVPKYKNELTEIDILLICSKGLFVFESKNYSGWIFGDEKNKTWTQSLSQGRGYVSHKEYFYNPILQNYNHIKFLTKFLQCKVVTHSLVVFSDKCTLKDITIYGDTRVVNCQNIFECVSEIYNASEVVLTELEVNDLYKKLYPLTQLSRKLIEEHTLSINSPTY